MAMLHRLIGKIMFYAIKTGYSFFFSRTNVLFVSLDVMTMTNSCWLHDFFCVQFDVGYMYTCLYIDQHYILVSVRSVRCGSQLCFLIVLQNEWT